MSISQQYADTKQQLRKLPPRANRRIIVQHQLVSLMTQILQVRPKPKRSKRP